MHDVFQRFKDNVFRTMNKNLNQRDSSLSAVLGIADETFETLDLLLSKSTIEGSHDLYLELGDLAWYTMYLYSLHFASDSIDLQKFNKPRELDLETLHHELVVEVGGIMTLMKHCYFHGHFLDPEILKASLISIFQLISDIANCAGATFSKILKLNIDKLKKRYPDGFSPEASINRRI